MCKFIILVWFLFLFEQQFVQGQSGGWFKRPPREPRWHLWAEDIVNVHLANMTAELLKDMELKLEQIKSIQAEYMHSMTYDLGTIAASVQDTYRQMLEIYRIFSNLDNFIKNKYTIDQVLDAYHLIQGGYNKIRLDKGMFYKKIDEHVERRERNRKRIRDNFGGLAHPNEAKLLGMMPRRAFGNLTLNAEFSDSLESNVQVDPEFGLVAPRRKEDGAGLPRLPTTTLIPKKKWKHRAKWYPEETNLDNNLFL